MTDNMEALMHHGIEGMRWGIRRYQNSDGSLTAAGKKRYLDDDGNLTKEGQKKVGNSIPTRNLSDSDLQAQVKRMALEKQRNNFSKENAPPDTLKTAKSGVDALSNIVDKAKRNADDSIKNRPKEKLFLDDMTDQELRDRINRANLERQYSDIFAQQVPIDRGKERVARILETTGTVLALTGSAITIISAIKEIKRR